MVKSSPSESSYIGPEPEGIADLDWAEADMIGTANAYFLNPDETWRTAEESKYAFHVRVKAMIGKSENPAFRQRLTHVAGRQRDLFEG